MLTKQLHRAGVKSWHAHVLSLGAIYLCLGLWIRAKTVDQEERGNAERRAIFVGLWPPTLWLIGDSLKDHELGRSGGRATRRRAATLVRLRP